MKRFQFSLSVIVQWDHWLADLVIAAPKWLGRIESVRVGDDMVNYCRVGFWN